MKVKELHLSLGTLHNPDGAKLLINIGSFAGRKHDFVGALAAYEEARQIYEQHGISHSAHGAQLLLNIAIAKWNSKDAEGALEAGQASLAILETIGMQRCSDFTRAQQLVEIAKQMMTSQS